MRQHTLDEVVLQTVQFARDVETKDVKRLAFKQPAVDHSHEEMPCFEIASSAQRQRDLGGARNESRHLLRERHGKLVIIGGKDRVGIGLGGIDGRAIAILRQQRAKPLVKPGCGISPANGIAVALAGGDQANDQRLCMKDDLPRCGIDGHMARPTLDDLAHSRRSQCLKGQLSSNVSCQFIPFWCNRHIPPFGSRFLTRAISVLPWRSQQRCLTHRLQTTG
ncbi:hypothetical protein ACC760_10140 [Rhizobium ruizarguesonis]